MKKLTQLYKIIQALFHKSKLEEGLSEELLFHLDCEIEKNLQAGMSPEEAHYAALREFGGVEQTKEKCRDVMGIRWLEEFWQDLRFGIRMLLKTPGFTAVAISTLALGIGANSTMFSIMDGMWFQPSQVPKAFQLARLSIMTKDGQDPEFSYPDYEDYRDQNKSFSGLAAWSYKAVTIRGEGLPEYLSTAFTSDNYFSVFNVQTTIGRPYISADFQQDQSEMVAVISHSFWQRHFSGDPNIAGKAVQINQVNCVILGVLPPKLKYDKVIYNSDIWIPARFGQLIGFGHDFADRDYPCFQLIGRLAEGCSIRRAQTEMAGISNRLEQTFPTKEKRGPLIVQSDLDYRLKQAGSEGLLLSGIVVLILLMCCINVANLLMARTDIRRKEFATRLALGAGRWRLVRQLMTENILLAAGGGVASLLICRWLTRLIQVSLDSPVFPDFFAFQVDTRVLVFTFLITLLTGFLFGITPAFKATRLQLAPELKGEVAPPIARWKILSWRHSLILSQIAISMALLVETGLFCSSLVNAWRAQLGFDRKNMLLASTYAFYDAPLLQNLYQQWVERVKQLPGVKGVTFAMRAPMSLSEGGSSVDALIPGYSLPSGKKSLRILYNAVGPDFFKVMGTRILKGRAFDDHDTAASQRVVVINGTMSRRFWPNQDPIGHRVMVEGDEYQIIGVAEDARINSITERPDPYLYLPYSQFTRPEITLLVETVGDPRPLAKAVRTELLGLDKTLPVSHVYTLKQLIHFQTIEQIRMALLVGGLGTIALILASIGLYGLISYFTNQRTREFGIRIALGAQAKDVLHLVLKQSIGFLVLGISAGLILAILFGRIAANLLYGVTPTDVTTLVFSSLFFASIAGLACFIPARRATQVDPLVALRSE
jgi:predicted permease